ARIGLNTLSNLTINSNTTAQQLLAEIGLQSEVTVPTEILQKDVYQEPLPKGIRQVYDNIPPNIRTLAEEAGLKHGVPPALLLANIGAESSFKPDARSKAGALGIAQFTEETAREYGVDRTDVASSIDGMARYLKKLHDEFNSWESAIGAYNSGPNGPN